MAYPTVVAVNGGNSTADYSIIATGIASAAAFGTPTVDDTTPHIEIAGSVNLSVHYAVQAPTEAVSISTRTATMISVGANIVDSISVLSASTESVSILCEAVT